MSLTGEVSRARLEKNKSSSNNEPWEVSRGHSSRQGKKIGSRWRTELL